MRRNSTLSWLLALVVGIVILGLELLYRAGICGWAVGFPSHSLIPGILIIVLSLPGLIFWRRK